MKLIFSSRAKADLIAIGDFIAMDSPLRAYRLVETIEQKCAALCQTPARYPLVPRHEESGIRRMVHDPYLIFYRIEAGAVQILHILHGAQDMEAILFPQD